MEYSASSEEILIFSPIKKKHKKSLSTVVRITFKNILMMQSKNKNKSKRKKNRHKRDENLKKRNKRNRKSNSSINKNRPK
jgi:hypothetical protein